jgi:hypothetical protein
VITPDTKDWTWVLDRPCAECGYDAATVRGQDVPSRLLDSAAAWRAVLARPVEPRVRPAPDVWSPLEYACHVRDVCRVYDERLRLMLTEDNPRCPNWDQDRTAVEDRYAEQAPPIVADELAAAAEILADRFAGISGDAWQRTGSRSDGAHFTIETFARYFLHDVVHHLHDVRAEPTLSA